MNLSKIWDDFQRKKAKGQTGYVKTRKDKPTVRELLDKYLGNRTINERYENKRKH